MRAHDTGNKVGGNTAYVPVLQRAIHLLYGCLLYTSAMRKRDAEQVNGDEYYKQLAFHQFKTLGKKAYPVLCSSPDEMCIRDRIIG